MVSTFVFADIQGPTSALRVSALGGAEETIADGGANADWTPDGRSLVVVVCTPDSLVRLFITCLRLGGAAS